MNIFRTDSLASLQEFAKQESSLAIVERTAPEYPADFFERLMAEPFSVVGQVYKSSAEEDIMNLLQTNFAKEIYANDFFAAWISDMADICKAFCDLDKTTSIGFWLGSERGCRRYHVDHVPWRLLVTYAGKGTEWLPDAAADRSAFANGAPNEKIVKDLSAKQFMKPWDIAVFRGGQRGVLHRTPDEALHGPSILMRLDQASFWESSLSRKQQNGNK